MSTPEDNFENMQTDGQTSESIFAETTQATECSSTASEENSSSRVDLFGKLSKWKNSTTRTTLEIVGGILLILLLLSSASKVSSSTYNDLQKAYEAQSEELQETKDSLGDLTKEYNLYKVKMRKFDSLSDEEADALISEIDRIEAEKKAEAEKAAAEKKAEAEKAAAEEKAKQDALSRASTEQKNALNKAKSYLKSMAFSYSGLIGQLEFEGFSNESATYAVDNCGADWNEQAAKKAQSYMDFMSFSREGLIDQLLFEGFSSEQAEYGASAVGY